ncbi:MAG: hypothetical protein OEZ65_11145 [Gemmatimonadota bacterium]|nr:hypothetical protein [Gemmatimonadota bacterium]MDH5760135.1 hypothetical protein [Gemmatimonadota bacterium]
MRLPILRTAPLLLVPLGLAGQERSPGAPNAVFPEDFGAIQTVREMPDGRLLVADPLGKALYLVDMDRGTRVRIGSEGQGPGEYLQPDATWPLPGDSTLLVDLGNGRLTALGPGLDFGPTMPITQGEFSAGRAPVLALPQGVDASGHLYARSLGGGMGGVMPDSAAILRIRRGTGEVDTVARFKTPDVRRSVSGGARDQSVRIEPVRLSPEDAWGVAGDGSVVVARAGDYHVEWFHPGGSVVRGAPRTFRPIPVGESEKEEDLAESGRSGGGIGISVENVNGRVSMSFARGAGSGRELDAHTWNPVKPPFHGGRIPVDGSGRAWIRVHTRAGEASRYDVFGPAAEFLRTFVLDGTRRIVGFGAGSMYVAAFDQFDLTYLERYALPGS